MRNTADYVIIGGGISGVSIGYFLLKHGASNVVILERNYLASGATGRCGAGIRQQWGSALNCVLTKYSCEFFENADEYLGFPGGLEFHQGGYLFLATTEKEFEQTRLNVALQNSLGIQSQFITPQEAKDIAPILDASLLLGASYHHKDGHLNPFRTTQAFADKFTQMGGKIYKNTKVTGIKIEQGKVTSVETNNGSIKTNTVINAAGGYVQQIADMVGSTLPLYSERHNILVTEPVAPALNTMLMSIGMNFYCQQVPHGAFIMGRTCKNQPRDLRITDDSEFLEHMASTITLACPRLANLRILRQWSGLYNMSPDKHPIYDKIPEVDGFYIAAGYSGHGFMLAPATGQIMAEQLLGLTPTLPWNKLKLDRFEKGELNIEPSVV